MKKKLQMLTQKKKKMVKNQGHPQEISVANTNPYYPYNQELFGHDEASTPELGEN